MKNLCICSAATSDYLNRLITLYKSYVKNCSKVFFHVHLINIDEDNFFEKNPSKWLSISYSNIDPSDTNVIRAYASNVRCRLLRNLIKKHSAVLWFDADSIIRRDLGDLFKLFESHIILAHKKEKSKEELKWKTGIIGFKSHKICVKFLDEWINETFSNGDNNCHWFQDQEIFGRKVKKLLEKDPSYIYNISRSYIDWKLKEKSHIWVGKGEQKNNKIYLKEEEKFN